MIGASAAGLFFAQVQSAPMLTGRHAERKQKNAVLYRLIRCRKTLALQAQSGEL
jgi:hypothetical protein